MRPVTKLYYSKLYARSKVKVKVMGPKVAKMANFKVYLLRRYAGNQKTNGEL